MRPLGPAVFFKGVRGFFAGLALAAIGWLCLAPLVDWRPIAVGTVAAIVVATTISVTDEVAARVHSGFGFGVRFLAGFSIPFSPIVGLLSFGSTWQRQPLSIDLLGPLGIAGFFLGIGRAIAGLRALTQYRLVVQAAIPGLLAGLFITIIPPYRRGAPADSAISAIMSAAVTSASVLLILGLLAIGHALAAPIERRIEDWLALETNES